MSYYEKKKNRNIKKYAKFSGAGLILIGILLVFYFFFPLISYQVFLADAFEKNNIEVPIPKHEIIKNTNTDFGSLVASGITSLTRDYTDARNWYPDLFDKENENNTRDVAKDKYTLSIPKLKIENAYVSTIDYDLSQHLVQHFGTAMPGEAGTAVVFGHSTIPSWFNPKDYKTVFATLHTIKMGDEIFVNIGEKTYKYKIFSIVVTSPKDVNILSQSFDNSYLTLVTCTPPGTIWKRLVVRAALERDDNSI